MPERAKHTILSQLLNSAGGNMEETNALLETLAARIVLSDMSLDSSGQWTIATNTGVGRAPSTDVVLHVGDSGAMVTGNKTMQVDQEVTSGTGGILTGLQVNTRAPASGSWDGTDGQLFGIGVEASTRKTGTAEIFGANLQAVLWAGATGGNQLTGMEIDCISEAAPASRYGLAIAAVPSTELPSTEGVATTGGDAMILLSNKNFGARWKDGILFLNTATTRWPIDTTGALIRVDMNGNNSITSGIDFSDANLTITGNAIALPGPWIVTGAGLTFIGDNANAGMTLGLTINQLANDNQILSLKSSDVTQGAVSWLDGTGNTETDDFGGMQKTSATLGGLNLGSFGANDAALTNNLKLTALGGQASTTKSTSGRALAEILLAQHDGAGAVANVAADGNIFALRARRGGSNATVAIVDEDGDLWLDGAARINSATLITTGTAFTDGAAANTGTLTNAPAAGNPTKWIPVDDNGTTRYLPAW